MVWMFSAGDPKTAREGARAIIPRFAESLGYFMIRITRKECVKCRLATHFLSPSRFFGARRPS